MANEIAFDYQPTGATTLYAILRLQKQMVNASTGALQAISSANWTSSVITLSDTGNVGHYFASVPGSTPAGDYSYSIASNASPVIGDTTIGIGNVSWTGTAESFPLASSSATATSVGVTGGSVSATVSGGSGMTLSNANFTPTVSSTPTTTADTAITNNSGLYAVDFTSPGNSAMTWSLYVRRASGAKGLFVASNATVQANDGNTYTNGVPPSGFAQYQIQTAITGSAYYFVVTSSSASGQAAAINCVS